jgi:hypothetical protein
MEHRLHPRISSSHTAWISIGTIPPLATTTGNISADGLLLKMTHPSLTPTKVIQVAVEHGANHSQWRSRAIVVHTSRSGTGVLLLNPLPEAMTAMAGTRAGVAAVAAAMP